MCVLRIKRDHSIGGIASDFVCNSLELRINNQGAGNQLHFLNKNGD